MAILGADIVEGRAEAQWTPAAPRAPDDTRELRYRLQVTGSRCRKAAGGEVQSMSRKGNCLDNSIKENWLGIMKSEPLYPNKYSDIELFKKDLIEYIDYYNNRRIKLKLKGLSPVQYRTKSFQSASQSVQ